MKCETVRDSDQEDDDDDDGSDEEILQLRAQIKKKKMLRKQHSRGQRLLSTDAYTRSSSTPTKSTDSSLSSGSPHSSYSRKFNDVDCGPRLHFGQTTILLRRCFLSPFFSKLF